MCTRRLRVGGRGAARGCAKSKKGGLIAVEKTTEFPGPATDRAASPAASRLTSVRALLEGGSLSAHAPRAGAGVSSTGRGCGRGADFPRDGGPPEKQRGGLVVDGMLAAATRIVHGKHRRSSEVSSSTGPSRRRNTPELPRRGFAVARLRGYPRRGRGGSATRLRGISTSRPRRRDPSPRNIRVVAAAAPRPVAAEYPRRGRGGSASGRDASEATRRTIHVAPTHKLSIIEPPQTTRGTASRGTLARAPRAPSPADPDPRRRPGALARRGPRGRRRRRAAA